jgi:hypothetical protein
MTDTVMPTRTSSDYPRFQPGSSCIEGKTTMSGITSGDDYSLLFSGTWSASDTASSMLTTLYSGSGATTGSGTAVSSGNPILDLKLAEQN